MLAFTSIFLTALAAFFGAPVWTALIGAGALVAISVSNQKKFATRFRNIGAAHVLTMAAWQSAGHALLTSAAAFGLGIITKLCLTA